MPVSSSYRWIAVGQIRLGVRGNPKEGQCPKIDDLRFAIEDCIKNNKYKRYYDKDDRVMWCVDFREKDGFYQMVIHDGNRDVDDVSRVDIQTLVPRKIPKASHNEGSHYSAHVLISCEPDEYGRHMIFVERVPGIQFSSIQRYFRWIMKDRKYYVELEKENGEVKKYRALAEIRGHQSKTIREALKEGVLQDIELVGHQEIPDGFDEKPLIKEITSGIKINVRKKITDEQAPKIEKWIRHLFEKRTGLIDPHAVVRIKANTGQIKGAEVKRDRTNILEQAFTLNELADQFGSPIPQGYNGFYEEMIEKMKKIALKMRS